MPAQRVERETTPAYAELGFEVFSVPWQGYVRNIGIMMGFVGIATLPLMILPGVALLAAGMELLWLTSPGLV